MHKITIIHHIERNISLSVVPSDDLYRMVRAGFIAKGTTLNAWCIANGVNRQTAEKSLKGQRESKRSRELRDLLVSAALNIKSAA